MFNEAFAKVFSHEGGYTDDPKDRGNWTSGLIGTGKLNGTKYGISAMSYPNVDIKSLTYGDARDIYKADYWDKQKIGTYPEELQFELFDMNVNMGWRNAVKVLQQALGFTGKDVDGLVGPKTTQAIAAVKPKDLLVKVWSYRIKYYTGLSTFNTYGKGWVNRVANNMADFE